MSTPELALFLVLVSAGIVAFLSIVLLFIFSRASDMKVKAVQLRYVLFRYLFHRSVQIVTKLNGMNRILLGSQYLRSLSFRKWKLQGMPTRNSHFHSWKRKWKWFAVSRIMKTKAHWTTLVETIWSAAATLFCESH